MAKPLPEFAIVADIGGTNARFSRVSLSTLAIDFISVYPCERFSGLAEALQHYRKEHELQSVSDVAIAIACPVTSDHIQMTNTHWAFSVMQVKAELALSSLIVINDFTAVAMCLPALSASQKVQVGRGGVQADKPMAVLGAGTGLGVAHLIPAAGNYIPLPGEGGHINWAPQNEQEWFIHQFLEKKFGHVSPERLMSGPGLENIYQALALYRQQSVVSLTAAEIATQALSQQNELAMATIAQFFSSLGDLAGDLALTLNTAGGVYIAGGITPRLLPLIEASDFRRQFEAKGRLSALNCQIASYVVTAEQPGLLGAAVYLKQSLAS